MNRKLYLFSIVFIFLVLQTYETYAQSGFIRRQGRSNLPERGISIQAGVGTAAVKSDICGSWGCNNLGPSVSIGALYKMSPYLGVNTEAKYLRLGATEKVPTMNIAFQSEVIQLAVSGVLNLADSYSGSGGYRSARKRFAVPYVTAGIGFVYYTATSFPSEANLYDSQEKYDPERNYPAIAGVVPFGGGIRFRYSDQISIAPEMIYHFTTTDYLDNIGARLGNAGTWDHFGTASIKVVYTPSLKNEIFSRKNQRK